MLDKDAQESVDTIGRIEAVPTILDVVCRTTGMGFAAVARVTEGRWIACGVKDDIAFGLQPGGELKVETTICHEIRKTREPVIIDNTAEDAVYSKHPTPAIYGFQSYISMPIMLPDGSFFGTLCAINPTPVRLNTPEVIGMFKLFAELLAYHIDATSRLSQTSADLVNERRIAELREVFIAILGHDLRNPIAAINSGMRLLLRMPLPERAHYVLDLMQGSVNRMTELVGNMLDLARGRLTGGIPVRLRSDVELDPVLRQIMSEISAAFPDRIIESRFSITEPVTCDANRIAQLFSNLLSNAVTYGGSAKPILCEAGTKDGVFSLSVANGGEPIPEHRIAHLFEPFSRGVLEGNQQGLGLGLHIASEIARAHAGVLGVTSTADETRFTFQMPCAGGLV